MIEIEYCRNPASEVAFGQFFSPMRDDVTGNGNHVIPV